MSTTSAAETGTPDSENTAPTLPVQVRSRHALATQHLHVEMQRTQHHEAISRQLMQLSNFYCNWKTIHHRNFMVGLGESVIYNK